ncbi:cell wall-active antibiotic response 4TMS protein YvqF [Streptomyces sp. PanSC19]|uniref:DUF1707 SHOCT-like domain-containing protein n=1 Tax=Streptomyces sp. PanSC19 TaxID=1520455 RepID=UPI000F466FB4|nr:DUF1707 domain-containing protein [Streptomyces sp. PanSC19]ROQ27037.1 cell wall-active antibiotic response 4TMS protein YvqF [Streptomyces sp. PanSC19]
MTRHDLDVLASDRERSDAEERLRAAVGSGRLPLADLAGRLDEVHASRTRGDLEQACRGLPRPGPRDSLVVDRPADSRGLVVGVFGGFVRKGPWVVPPRMTVWSMWGGGKIDLTEARFSEQDTEIRAVALWGGTRIVVPEDIEVEVRGFGLFGVFDRRAARRIGRPGTPRVVIKGLALFGAVVTRGKG